MKEARNRGELKARSTIVPSAVLAAVALLMALATQGCWGGGCSGQCGTGEGWDGEHAPLGIENPDPDFGQP